ncbi:MAG: sigma-70 family RNA polymerase sigma factor [Candidatus Cloacimonadales bacterium]
MEKQLKIALGKAKQIAMNYVKNEDKAEEIAQLSSIQLFLNYDKIDKAKINSWLFTVTRNLCLDYFRENKTNKELLVDSQELEKYVVFENQHPIEELNLDLYSFISARDKAILKKYYYDNVPITKLAQSFKIKQPQLKHKIYLLENEIKLFHLFDCGEVYFKPVPATKLTKNLNRFISILVEALQTNDLHLMKRYFKDAIVHSSIDKIKIKSYEASKIKVECKNDYLIVIGYLDFDDNIRVFNIRFTITDSGNIRVLEIPIIPEKVLLLDKKIVDPKSLEKKYTNKKGFYNNKLGTVEEMEKKGIGKVIQTKEDFE